MRKKMLFTILCCLFVMQAPALLCAQAGAPLPREESGLVLAWKLREGQRLAVSWKVFFRMNLSTAKALLIDAVMEIGGVLEVLHVTDGTAECRVVFTRMGMSGTLEGKKKVDLLIDGGEIQKSEGMPKDQAANLREQLETPGRLTITSRGLYSGLTGPDMFSGLFQGQSDFFGCQLPDAPVAVGAEWHGALKGTGVDAPDYDVTYRLESVTAGIAWIRLDTAAELDFEGVHLDMLFQADSFFDHGVGICLWSASTMTAKGRQGRQAFDILVTMNYTAAPLEP